MRRLSTTECTYLPTFTKSFRLTLATFEECPMAGTSFTVHFTDFQGLLQCDRLL